MKADTLRHKIGTRLIWRNINLRHFVDSMIVVGYDKDGDYMVKHQGSGCVGKCGVMVRDVQAWDENDKPTEYVCTSKRPQNDCLGLSWQQIESMQGGKLS